MNFPGPPTLVIWRLVEPAIYAGLCRLGSPSMEAQWVSAGCLCQSRAVVAESNRSR